MCDNINAFNSIELPLYKCSPYTLWEWEQSTQFISHIEFNFTSNRFFFIALLLYMWKSVCCSMTSQHIFRQWTKNLRLISLKNFMKFGILVGLGWDDRLVNGLFFVLLKHSWKAVRLVPGSVEVESIYYGCLRIIIIIRLETNFSKWATGISYW